MKNGDSSYRRFLEGEQKAFDDIMLTYREGLTFFIMRYVGDESVAEDICIDVFCELLTHPRRYNGRSSLKTYIFMIGRSRALDFLRRKNKILMLPLENAMEHGDTGVSPEDAVCISESKKAVNEAIRTLPQNMQLAVHLVYFEELSYKQAAKVLKVSEKQIDNLLYNARKKLEKTLRKEELI